MNSVCVALVASPEALLLPAKIEWLLAGMGTNLLAISYYEWTSDGFWSFVGLYSTKECSFETMCTLCTHKKSYRIF
jgi:amino acid transporter